MGHFLTNMSNRVEHQKLNQTTAELSFGWVFGVQLGLRQTQALIKTKTIRRRNVPPAKLLLSSKLLLRSHVAGGTLPLLIVLVLISACVCRRPSWTPKTQPNDSSAVVWLSFWCSTRLLMSVKKCLGYRGKTCTWLTLKLCFTFLWLEVGVLYLSTASTKKNLVSSLPLLTQETKRERIGLPGPRGGFKLFLNSSNSTQNNLVQLSAGFVQLSQLRYSSAI